MSLTAPGMPQRSAQETNQRLSSALVEALKNSLQAESGAPQDAASLVIQRGWLPEGLVAPENGKAIRHLNFPEEAWQEHQLLRADDGSYLDPARQIVWTRDGDGRAFEGRKVTEETDIAAYKVPEESGENTAVASLGPRTAPEGFVIEDPVTHQAEVVIDQVPAPAEGNQHQIVWQDASGASGTLSVESVSVAMGSASSGSVRPFAVGNGNGNANGHGNGNGNGNGNGHGNASGNGNGNGASVTQYSVGGMLLYTLPNVSNLTSFRLIELPIVPNGSPPRVIVAGGR
jgi:hypothetical protein